MSTAGEHALELLRAYVEKVGSARRAAWATGIGPERISRWFSGKEVFSPTLTTLEKMAAAMGVSVSVLLGGADPAPGPDGDQVKLNAMTLDADSKTGLFKMGIARQPFYAHRSWFDGVGRSLGVNGFGEPGRVWVVVVSHHKMTAVPPYLQPLTMLVVDRGPEGRGIGVEDFHQGGLYLLRKKDGVAILRLWLDTKERMLVVGNDRREEPPSAIVYGDGDVREHLFGLVVRASINTLPKQEVQPHMVRELA